MEVLFEKNDIGSVFGYIGRRVHRDSDVGGVQSQRIVHAVAEKGHGAPGLALYPHDPRPLLGTDAGEYRGGADQRGEVGV